MVEKKTDALPKHVINMAWILVLGAIAPMLDATMVNIAVNDLARDFGARYVTIVSLFITLVGKVPFVYFDGHTAYWLVGLVLLVRGIGAGGILSPLMTDAFVGASQRDSGSISVASCTFQNIGGAYGSAVIATVVAGYMTTHTGIAAGHQTGFAWSAGLSLLILIPAMFLTNKLSKK